MDEQVQKLKAIFKPRKNSQDEDNGDNNTFGEYQEFQELDKVEFLNIELDPMTRRSHFVYKFKNSSVFFPISYNKSVKDVFFEHGGIILIHCVTNIEDLYIFTICLDYNKSPFDLTIFLRSLENSNYEAVMKEIKDQEDKKKWLNKEEFLSGQRPWCQGLGN